MSGELHPAAREALQDLDAEGAARRTANAGRLAAVERANVQRRAAAFAATSALAEARAEVEAAEYAFRGAIVAARCTGNGSQDEIDHAWDEREMARRELEAAEIVRDHWQA